MNPHLEVIEKFYTAFQQKDWKTMQSCYHENIRFSDPAFQSLAGAEAKAMWHMLAINARDFSLVFRDAKAEANHGSCYWEASYTFSKTGRRVVNKIHASFEFKDGLISKHTDRFDFWKWTRMALGMPGLLLGWSSFLQNKVRKTANSGLKKFMQDNSYK
jgi:ketosteroid isomerase-like protein